MPVSKCCVQSCNCNLNNCTLSTFPRNITLNKIWLDLVKPHSPDLRSGLAFICDQGATFRACMTSFQNDSREHRLRNDMEPDSSILINRARASGEQESMDSIMT